MNWANFIFDCLLALILLLGICIGYKKGFISILFKRMSWVGALVVSYFFSDDVVSAFGLSDRVREPIYAKLSQMLGTTAGGLSDISERLPQSLKVIAQLFNVDLTLLADNAMNAGGDFAETFAASASEKLSVAVSTVIVFVALFFVSWIVIRLVGHFIRFVFKAPVLKQINGVLGAILTLFFFCIFTLLFCYAVDFLSEYTAGISWLHDFRIRDTTIGGFFLRLFSAK